jgi:hypothetical protein
MHFRGISSSTKTVRSLGEIRFSYRLGRHVFSSLFYIVGSDLNFDTDILFGMDVMGSLPWMIDFSKRKMLVKEDKKNKIPQVCINLRACKSESICIASGVCDDYTLRTPEVVKIPPYSRQIIYATVESLSPTSRIPDGTPLVVEKERTELNIGLAQSLGYTKEGCIAVELVNLNSTPKCLDKNLCLGRAFLAREDESVPSIRLLATDSKSLGPDQIREEYRKVLSSTSSKDPESDVLQDKEQLETLVEFLAKNRDVIALKGDAVGKTSLAKFQINLKPGTKVIYVPPYRVPHSQQVVLENHVQEMLDQNIIRPSLSPYNSPLILVKKKDGTLRPCVDFRKLNLHTVPDYFPIPNMQEVLQTIGNAKIFTTCDLLSGFWHMEVEPSSRQYTAFSTTRGRYEWNRLPFGV